MIQDTKMLLMSDYSGAGVPLALDLSSRIKRFGAGALRTLAMGARGLPVTFSLLLDSGRTDDAIR